MVGTQHLPLLGAGVHRSGQGEGDLGQGREVARTQGAVLVHRGQRAAVQG
ncbi:hypothetical protein ACWDHW_33845 [Streptomyces melanosporofaciens]